VLEPYLRDDRIHYRYQKNQGQAVAKNHGLTLAQGEYVCFLDSDNYWPEYKLERSLEFMQAHPEVDILYGDIITVNEHGEEITRKNMPRYSGRITRYLLRDNYVSINTSMTRRRCFDEMGMMDPDCKVACDYELWLRFSVRYVFHYLPEFLAYYRVMQDQISSNKDRRLRYNEMILRNFQRRFPDAVAPAVFREGWCRFHTRKARYLMEERRMGEALASLGRAFASKPWNKAPWRALAKWGYLLLSPERKTPGRA